MENEAHVGDPYVQPSPLDGAIIGMDEIGTLHRFVPISFEEYVCRWRNRLMKFVRAFGIARAVPNRVDVAAVKPYNPADARLEILDIGKVLGKREGKVGEFCEKSGRTTCHTTGARLIDRDWCGYVAYSRGRAWFEDCGLIEKEGFSAGGDSSSAIIASEDKSILGLLFAGSRTHTIYCKVYNIERELNVEVVISPLG